MDTTRDGHLSFAQELLIAHCAVFECDPDALNIQFAIQLPPEVDSDLLLRAVKSVVTRHWSLRTFYEDSIDGLQPVTYSEIACPLGNIEIEEGEPGLISPREFQIAAWAMRATPIDHQRWPLCRWARFAVEGEGEILVCTLHHLVADEPSMRVLYRQLASALSANPPIQDVVTDGPDFGQYIAAQRKAYDEYRRDPSSNPRWSAFSEDWSALSRDLQPVVLPGPGGPRAVGKRSMISFDLSMEDIEALDRLCTEEGCTRNMVVLSALQAALAKWAHTDRPVVMAEKTLRMPPSFRDVVGYFPEPVWIAVEQSSDLSFLELLKAVEGELVRWLVNTMPMAAVLEDDWSFAGRMIESTSRCVVMFQFFAVGEEPAIEGAKWYPIDGAFTNEHAAVDVHACALSKPASLTVHLRYKSPLVSDSVAQDLLSTWRHILTKAVRDPSAQLSQLVSETAW